MQIKEIYEKFRSGDPLTDEELRIGESHFRNASALLFPLGPRFDLATNELLRVARGLEEFIIARKRK